jgi:hypothetical protein
MKLLDTVSLSYKTDSLEVCIISDKNCESVVFLEGGGGRKEKGLCLHPYSCPPIHFL